MGSRSIPWSRGFSEGLATAGTYLTIGNHGHTLRAMTADQLRKALHARPFRPFTLYMADGRKLRVVHPDFVAISPTGRTAAVYPEGDDGADQIDLLLVTRIGLQRPRKDA